MFEWSYDMGDNKPLPITKFSSTARAMALRDETIYRASNNVVELCNLNGIVRQKMTFSEGEGSPLILMSTVSSLLLRQIQVLSNYSK